MQARHLFITSDARSDLIEIWTYIARDNPLAADRLMARINRAFDLIATFPLIGVVDPEIGKGRRRYIVGKYLLIYRIPDRGGIEVLRIYHGARDRRRLK
jgi:toxin ParE1/3/4